MVPKSRKNGLVWLVECVSLNTITMHPFLFYMNTLMQFFLSFMMCVMQLNFYMMLISFWVVCDVVFERWGGFGAFNLHTRDSQPRFAFFNYYCHFKFHPHNQRRLHVLYLCLLFLCFIFHVFFIFQFSQNSSFVILGAYWMFMKNF